MNKSVVLGESTYPVPKVTGYKGIVAGRLIAKLTRHSNMLLDELADFVRSYEQKHSIEVTPSMSRLPKFAGLNFSEEDFAASGGVIRLPASPTFQEQIMVMFPRIMEVAEEEATKLLALVLISNKELREADEEGNVDEVLSKKAKEILHEAAFDELIDIVVTVQEVLVEQLKGKEDKLGKLRSLLGRQSANSNRDSTESQTKKPNSSTPSPSPMDGDEMKSSFEMNTEASGVS